MPERQMLTGLPALHKNAVGTTTQGVYYTREQYETLRARGTPMSMSETPDFKKIARDVAKPHAERVDEDGEGNMVEAAASLDDLSTDIEAALRLVWNARGAADVVAIRARMSTLVGWEASEPYLQHVAEAVAAIDR